MKMTKLSLIAAIAASSAFAGGDIAPVQPAVAAPAVTTDCNADTTIAGKGTFYYMTDAHGDFDLFDAESSSAAVAVTLDVAHKLTDNITANFSAVGFSYLGDSIAEDRIATYGEKRDAFFNVANLTGTFGDTTVIAGRQLLDTPMLGSFDWLLAPSGFEALTVANNSFENITLVASYVNKLRAVTSNTFNTLDGDNYALGAVYDDKTINGSLWYYNVDAAEYTQVYADAGYNFDIARVDAQVATTDYDAGEDSTAYGIKVSGDVYGIALSAAYNHTEDAVAGMVETDAMYTSSWNQFGSQDLGDSFKVAAATEIMGVSAEVSFADYETNGDETDLILGYEVNDAIDTELVFTSTAYAEDRDHINALEFVANYKF